MFSGITKPASFEQPYLAGIVVDYVQRFVNQFTATDLIWVRSMKASKMGVLNCQCRTVQMASTVRSTFASLIKSDAPPTYLGKISISFCHQIGTRVRLSIMRMISCRQLAKEPNAICSVSAFSARPLLRVGTKEQGTRFLSYVDAINGYRHLLTQEDLDKALSMCTGLRGHLRSRFLVLSDDRVLPPAPSGRGKRAHPDDRAQGTTKRQNTSVPPPGPSWQGISVPSSVRIEGVNQRRSTSVPPPASVPVISGPVSSLPPLIPGSVMPQYVFSQPGHIAGAISSIPSPGAQFPPLGPPASAVQIADGYQKVKKRRPRRSKVDVSTADAVKVPTPTRTNPDRTVKTGRPALMDIASQDEYDQSSGTESEFVDAPPQADS